MRSWGVDFTTGPDDRAAIVAKVKANTVPQHARELYWVESEGSSSRSVRLPADERKAANSSKSMLNGACAQRAIIYQFTSQARADTN